MVFCEGGCCGDDGRGGKLHWIGYWLCTFLRLVISGRAGYVVSICGLEIKMRIHARFIEYYLTISTLEVLASCLPSEVLPYYRFHFLVRVVWSVQLAQDRILGPGSLEP